MSSKIAWTEITINPVVGCTKVSPGCANCYAEKWALRLAHIESRRVMQGSKVNGKFDQKYMSVVWAEDGCWSGEIYCDESALTKITPRQKPKKIFVNSMSDLFGPKVPFEFLDKVFDRMFSCPQHIYQILTKHPDRMKEYFEHLDNICQQMGEGDVGWSEMPNKNIWLGVSAENQEWWDKRKEALFATPAALHYVSFEPLLGEIILTDEDLKRLGWAIIGAESNGKWPGRECKDKWIGDIVLQCANDKVPCFVKQYHKLEYQVKTKTIMPILKKKSADILMRGYPQQYPIDKGE